MPSLSNKAQFFIITAVILAGFFYTISRYLNPYSYVDTSKSAVSNEVLMFNNFKDKAIKTVQLSDSIDRNLLEQNLRSYRSYITRIATENGYNLFFEFRNTTTMVGVNMTLRSDNIFLNTSFIIPRP